MKNLKRSIASLTLALLLSTAAIAGEIQSPGYVPPPPPPPDELNYFGEIATPGLIEAAASDYAWTGEELLLDLLLAAIF